MSSDLIKLISIWNEYVDYFYDEIDLNADYIGNNLYNDIINRFEDNLLEIKNLSYECKGETLVNELHQHIEDLLDSNPTNSFLKDLITLFY
jgi:hypothetical protein